MQSSDLFVADSDAKAVTAISVTFANCGWSVRVFTDSEQLVSAVLDRAPSCVLIDVQFPKQMGLATLERLRSHGYARPVLMTSGVFDASTIVAAIKRGADDFIQKPVRPEAVFDAVGRAVEAWAERQARRECHFGDNFVGRALLTKRETDVLRGIAAGATAKEAAALLELSPRTVEFYRARILSKLGAKNSADLMRIVME